MCGREELSVFVIGVGGGAVAAAGGKLGLGLGLGVGVGVGVGGGGGGGLPPAICRIKDRSDERSAILMHDISSVAGRARDRDRVHSGLIPPKHRTARLHFAPKNRLVCALLLPSFDRPLPVPVPVTVHITSHHIISYQSVSLTRADAAVEVERAVICVG